MTEEQLIKTLDLSPQEAKLYLAALEFSPATATLLSEKAGIERTASYMHLDRLVGMGLLSIRPEKGKSLYVAESPKKLTQILDNKRESLRTALPELMSIFNASGIKPKIRYYEGREGMRTILTNSISGESKENLHLNPFMNLLEIVGEEFGRRNIETRAQRGIRMKTLRKKEAINNMWEFTSHDPLLKREIKYLPEGFKLEDFIVIYGNTVGIVSSKKENYGLEIESKEFADTMRSFFNIVWAMAEKPKK